MTLHRFRLGYRAVETSSNFLMFLFLGIFALCSLFWAAAAVGVPQSAMGGMIVMIKLVRATAQLV